MPIGGTLASTQAGFDAGRAAERLRLVEILTSPEARRHPDTARSLAFDTLTPAVRALEVLCRLPPPVNYPGVHRGRNVASTAPALAAAARWDHVMRAAGRPCDFNRAHGTG